MARPPAKELTERELEVMHVFWKAGLATAAEIRDQLAVSGRELAYTTVATLIRILADKGFLEQTNSERPFQFRPVRSLKRVAQSVGRSGRSGLPRLARTTARPALGRAQTDRQRASHIGGTRPTAA